MDKRKRKPKCHSKRSQYPSIRELKHGGDDVAPDGRYYSSMTEGQYADEMARELGGE